MQGAREEESKDNGIRQSWLAGALHKVLTTRQLNDNSSRYDKVMLATGAALLGQTAYSKELLSFNLAHKLHLNQLAEGSISQCQVVVVITACKAQVSCCDCHQRPKVASSHCS